MKIETLRIGLCVDTKINLNISLWQAIKIRIAGNGYSSLFEDIKSSIKNSLDENVAGKD